MGCLLVIVGFIVFVMGVAIGNEGVLHPGIRILISIVGIGLMGFGWRKSETLVGAESKKKKEAKEQKQKTTSKAESNIAIKAQNQKDTEVAIEIIYCPNCGKELELESKVCNHCGYPDYS